MDISLAPQLAQHRAAAEPQMILWMSPCEHSKDRWSVVGWGSGLKVTVMMLAKIHTSAHASKRE